jgi:hypothetical protein
MNIRLGLSSYTSTWAVGVPGSMPLKPLSAYEIIDKAATSDLDLVQLADNLPLAQMQDDQVMDLYNYAVEKKVDIELGCRGLTPENTLNCLDKAEILHSPILRMVIDGPGFEPDLSDIKSIVRDLMPEFRKRNIRLAIENHDRFKARQFEDIILYAGAEWAGICLDSVNSMGAGEGFETVSEILVPYTINLHVKDFAIFRVPHKMGFVIEGRPAGSGMLDIERLIEDLSIHGRCRSAILELWTPPESDIDLTILKEDKWTKESLAYLKTIIKN